MIKDIKQLRQYTLHQYVIWDINPIIGWLGYLMFGCKADLLEYLKNNPLKDNQSISLQRGMSDDFEESCMDVLFYKKVFCKVKTLVPNKLYSPFMTHCPHTWMGFDYLLDNKTILK